MAATSNARQRSRIFDLAVRPSLFAHLTVDDVLGEFCVYHSLAVDTHFFPFELREWFERLDWVSPSEVLDEVPSTLEESFADLVMELAAAALLVPVEYDELGYLEQVRRRLFKTDHGRIRVMVVHLTGHCNLACSYCFVDGGNMPGYDTLLMQSSTARQAIDRFAEALASVPPTDDREVAQAPAVVFYGGEPLLNMRVFEETLEYIAEKKREGVLPQDFSKVLITNGTRIDRRAAELIAKHEVSVSLSMDGPQEIHDANRKKRGGQGSFSDVLRGFNNLRDVGVRPSIACVVAPEGVDHVPEIIRYFVEELGIKAVGMNHVSILPANGFEYDEDYEHKFAEAVIKGQETILEYDDVYERRMSQKMNTFLERRIVRADCTGAGEQVAVFPDGKINVCQGYVGDIDGRHAVGHVSDPTLDLNASGAVREWVGRSPLTMATCRGCISLAVCGGGCPRNAESLHGTIWEVDTAFCHFSRRSTAWMIWRQRQEERALASAAKA